MPLFVQTPGPEAKAKPKAKKLTERTSAWKALDFDAEDDQKEGEGEEEEEKEVDEEVDANDKRDYAKARKFGRLLKNGQVPDDILKMYNDDAMQSKQPRMYRTTLINELFRKDSKGEYIMCHKDPEFLSWKKNLDTSFATEKTLGVPYSIMLWQVFQGNELAMQTAHSRGDIYEAKGFWHHAKVSAGRTKQTTDEMQLKSGPAALSVDEYAGISNFMSSRLWAKFGQSCGDEHEPSPALKRGKSTLALESATFQGSSSSGMHSKQLALPAPAPEPKVVKLAWKVLQSPIGDAKDANERLQRNFNRLVVKVRGAQDDKLTEKMKTMVALLAENPSLLNQCLMWEQVPNSDGNEKSEVEKFLKELASKTDEVHEGMEEVKAVCKARGL